MMLSRPKTYKENLQAVRIIVVNKNIQALMTKHFIRSFSSSLMLFRNNNIVTQWVTTKIDINGLDPELYQNKHRINPE
jgi:hypothetical protein